MSLNNVTLHLKKPEKKKKMKPKINRTEEIIKIRAELRNWGCKKTEKINGTESWFFEKINKIDKPQARQLKIKEKGYK